MLCVSACLSLAWVPSGNEKAAIAIRNRGHRCQNDALAMPRASGTVPWAGACSRVCQGTATSRVQYVNVHLEACTKVKVRTVQLRAYSSYYSGMSPLGWALRYNM
jgi:hypothetical protein